MKIKIALFLSLFITTNLFSQKKVEFKKAQLEFKDGSVKDCFIEFKKGSVSKKNAFLFLTFTEGGEVEKFNMKSEGLEGVKLDSFYLVYLKIQTIHCLAQRLVDGDYELLKLNPNSGGFTYNPPNHALTPGSAGALGTGSAPVNSTGALSFSSTYYFLRHGEEVEWANNFKKLYKKHLGSCPEVMPLIDNYKNKLNLIEEQSIEIVETYNENCGK